MADTNALPLYLRFTSLPQNFQGSPQEIGDAIADGLEILAAQQFALFQRGSSEPSSDIGPWMDTSSTVGMWKAFDYITGRYVPMALDPLSLKYVLAGSAPDNTSYDVWFVLNGSGKGTGIDVYYDGAWHDVYEDQFAAINGSLTSLPDTLAPYAKSADVTAEIAAALSGLPGTGGLTADRGCFNAVKTSDQAFVANGVGGSFQIAWEGKDYDTSSAFSANQYLCKQKGIYIFNATVIVELTSGTYADTGYYLQIRVNGGSRGGPFVTGPVPPNQLSVHTTIQCELNIGDVVDVYMTAFNSTSATGRVINDTGNYFSGALIQAL